MSGYEAQASFLEPCEIRGTVEALPNWKVRDKIPELLIRLDNGGLIRVNCVQEHLKFRLVTEDPHIGDRIRLVYVGEYDKAKPGMSPTKIFRVAVRRAEEAPPPGRAPVSATGEVPGENGQEGEAQ